MHVTNLSDIHDGPSYNDGSTAARCWPHGRKDYSCHAYV